VQQALGPGPIHDWLPIALGLLGLIAALVSYRQATRGTLDHPAVRTVVRHIQEGAIVFLRRELGLLGIFVAVAAVLVLLSFGWRGAGALVLGASCSAAAAWAGVSTATRANGRTALAARDLGIEGALNVAFAGGSVMGYLVGGLGLVGLGALFVLFRAQQVDFQVIVLFGIGASSAALFARVGGGIYTKSADIGADLAGKLELKIPEDDPRNPGVIADNVGDNVGDIGGMGADLFESFCGSVIAALALAVTMPPEEARRLGTPEALVLLPLALAAVGMLASILTVPLVRLGFHRSPRFALTLGLVVAAMVYALASLALIDWLDLNRVLVWVGIAGALAGAAIGLSTEYFTSGGRVVTIANAGQTGAATVVIAGLTAGMRSVAAPLIVIGITIVFCSQMAGVYGVAMAAVSLLATVPMVMAADAYGPIADNAGGIAEMAHLGADTRRVTDTLDELGNTTAAIGKGFAIGAAALAALSLLSAFAQSVIARHPGFELAVSDPYVMLGLMLGSLLPFLFSAHLLRAVGHTAGVMVEEIRRQFREIPGLTEGTAEPDSNRCTEIAAMAAMRQVLLPGLLAIAIPPLVGFTLGPATLGGMLSGALLTGFLLAVFMANAGCAWDNAKKYVEQGHLGGKGSSVHDACVIGDTVGDPLKDTSGPSLNILIKLLAIASLAIAPLL
jgi:K(+)-stimulated pyrophosphate-energized sodium pump